MKVLILVLLVVAMAVSHPDPRRRAMKKRTHNFKHAPAPDKKVTGRNYWNTHTAQNAFNTFTAAVDAGHDIYDIINMSTMQSNNNNPNYDQQSVPLAKEDMKEMMQEMMQKMKQEMMREMMQELLQHISQTNNEASAPEFDTDDVRNSSTIEMIEE